MNGEERSNDGVALWSCPECAFTFDAAHTDTDGGGYSCPLCAEIDLESRLAAALARIAAVEAELAKLPGDIVGEIDQSWLRYKQTPGADHEHEQRLTGAMSGLNTARLIVQTAFRRAALAASPTPTGPEPAKCAHKRTEAHQMLDEFCEWTADCPGPATPEPTEETP